MLSRVIAKNIGDVFFETQCTTFVVDERIHYTCHEFHVINDRPASLVNLLTYSDTELFGVDGLV